ncbi:TetR/AcrR family transcriptional regulator [Nocardia arthritidis]|uniref:TetR family transcriptional regulator n=1 Tax=Nocardia arthritidis TaxID=228602 RepID=A0A6G9YQM1_9NOCA|nr:TetR/AcrR family transcriptional regulator [Nocardia arthritidis]QIS15502.1 TetR family transcriptional regulator [Nocardia arthritidis]
MTAKTPRGRNRRGEGARLREELVEAASRLLETLDGEESLSLRAVARTAGIAPQSVYLHFADRRELLTAVFRVRFAELREALSAARGPDPQARLREICRAYCEYGLRNPGHYRVLFGTAGAPGWEPTDEQLPGLPVFRMMVDAVRDCGSADPTATASCLWAGMHGLITLRQDRPSFPWLEMDILLDTLVAAHLAAAGAGQGGGQASSNWVSASRSGGVTCSP